MKTDAVAIRNGYGQVAMVPEMRAENLAVAFQLASAGVVVLMTMLPTVLLRRRSQRHGRDEYLPIGRQHGWAWGSRKMDNCQESVYKLNFFQYIDSKSML